MKWFRPEEIPVVEKGKEKEFWIAVNSNGKEVVFLAQYQNKPLWLDDDGDPTPDCEPWALCDCDGKFIDSVGWVVSQEHSEFDSFYSKILFSDEYRLLGWAGYTPPEFKGFNE